MIQLLMVALAGVFSPLSFSSAPQVRRLATLYLVQGEQRTLNAPDLEKFSLGSEHVRARRHGAGQESVLLLKAVVAGTTDLRIWNRDGSTEIRTLQVLDAKPSQVPEALGRMLSQLEEIEVIVGEKQVLLDGAVRTPQEIRRIGQIRKMFPEQVRVQVRPDPLLVDQAERALTAWIHRREGVFLERQGVQLLIRGSHASRLQSQEWIRQVEEIYPLVEVDINTLPDGHPTVYFRIYLLEILKSRFQSLGLSTRPSPESPGLQILRAFTQFQVVDVSVLDTTLQAMAHDGEAQILSRPELVVRVPGQAELFAGGEYPITNESRFFSKTDWKKHGLEFKLNATHDGGDRVRIEITSQWSQLGNRPEGSKIPAIQSNRMQTQVDAHYGRPLLLCGLIEDRQREVFEGIPGLKDIPILGRLFGSKDWRSDRSELVAVILPHRQRPLAAERLAPYVSEFEHYPAGPVPPPRDDGIRHSIHQLKTSARYPWNVFELQEFQERQELGNPTLDENR